MVTKVEQITDNANSYLTSTTSVEDIRAYLLALANKVAKALDLKVMPKLTKELTYGGAYYLGESENAEYPLMMVVNSTHQSFSYMYVYIGGVNKLGYQDSFYHVSTGGGATLKYMEDVLLVGIEAIDDVNEE